MSIPLLAKLPANRLVLAFFFALCLALAIVVLPPGSRATFPVGQSKTATGKRTRPRFVPGQVLVRYENETAANRQAAKTSLKTAQGRALGLQLERFGGSDLVGGLRIARVAPDDTAKAIEELRKQPDVLYAEPDYLLYPDAPPNDFDASTLYGLVKIGAPQAWETIKGSSNTAQTGFGSPQIVVGIVDEGIDVDHSDLHNNIWVNPMPGSITDIDGTTII